MTNRPSALFVDEGQQSSDVELKNAVRVGLVALVEGTGLNGSIEFELGRLGEVLGGRVGHRLDCRDSSEAADAPWLKKLIATHA